MFKLTTNDLEFPTVLVYSGVTYYIKYQTVKFQHTAPMTVSIEKTGLTMYVIDKRLKSDPALQWPLPDRVFFAAGACHKSTYAFIERHSEFKSIWIKPDKGFRGNHIIAVNGDSAFDYHGHPKWSDLVEHSMRKAKRWWAGWRCDLVELPVEVLISEAKSLHYDGLWLREPRQFLHKALPRARRFVDRHLIA